MKKTILFALIAASFLFLYGCNKKSNITVDKPAEVPATGQNKAQQINEQKLSLTPLQNLFAKAGFQLPQKDLASIDFKLKDLTGKTVSLESFRGSVVFLNFWATWCPPCKAELPSMQRLYEKYKGKGLVILGVDLQEGENQVKDFVKKYGLTYPILLDSNGQVGQVYGARSIPTSYIIDRKGFILARTIGGREWDKQEIFDLFEELLKK